MSGWARRFAAIGITIAAVTGHATADAAWRPDLAVQPDGTAHFSWMPGVAYTSYSVRSRALAPGGTLNDTQFIAEFDGDVRTNALGVDAAGRQTIVYEQAAGAVSAPFLRRRHPDGSLGPVHRLSAAGADGAAPEVAVEPDGDAVAVWTALSGNAAKRHVLARRVSAAGTLGPILTLSSSTYDADSAQVAVSPGGAATFVWRRKDYGEPTIQTRALSPAGALSPLQLLSYAAAQSSHPRVEMDANGTAVFVWSRAFTSQVRRVQLRRRSAAGTLSETLTISPSGLDADAPRLAVDPTGRAVVTWGQFDPTVIRARAQAADGTLGDLLTLSTTERNGGSPDVAIDPDGNAVVAWYLYGGGNEAVQARRRSASGALGAIQNLSTPGVWSSFPMVGMDAGGNAVVAWRRYATSGGSVIEARRRSSTGVLGAIKEIGQ